MPDLLMQHSRDSAITGSHMEKAGIAPMTDSLDGKRDFFISFNKADHPWAAWIAWVLEEAGYTVWFQNWDFKGNFVLEMDKAHQQSRRTIAVLSPDYLASRFTAPEWAARFAEDATNRHDLLVPIRIRETSLSGMLATIVYIDLLGITWDEARQRLLDRVAGLRLKPKEEPVFPGGPLPAEARSVPVEPLFPATSQIANHQNDIKQIPVGANTRANFRLATHTADAYNGSRS